MDNQRVGGSDMNYEKPEIQPGLEDVPEITPKSDEPDIEVINGALETYFPEDKEIPRKDSDGNTLH